MTTPITKSLLLVPMLVPMMTASVLGQATMSLKPVGGVGTSIDVLPGSTVTLEVFIGNVAPTLLRAYNVQLPLFATGGDSGTVRHDGMTPIIDRTRPDYVFATAGGTIVESKVIGPPPKILGTILSASGSVLITAEKYAGDFTYAVSSNALGVFTIDFSGVATEETALGDNMNGRIPFVATGATIRVICQTNADCDNNLFCDGAETCVAGDCVAGTAPCPQPGQPFCNETLNMCVQCFGALHCDDGNECTGNVCTTGVCSNPPLSLGAACGDPTNVPCNGADTCNGSGSCRNNLDPDGTVCPDDASDCTVDFCLGGICSHPTLPAGTACGSPATSGCDKPDRCDALGVCQSNFDSAGVPCGDPTNTDCNQADTCDGAGACGANIVSDGTACTDDANDCTSDSCSSGVCIHPNQPVNTPCGDPTTTECDTPDTCNGSGFCLNNFVTAGFPCGDPANTDCTNPDSCDGGGVCATNDIPDGTTCNDTLFCTTGETCSAGFCANGAPTDCDDGVACTADACNEAGGVCDHVLAATSCLIGGQCFAAGDRNPGNDCEECNPAISGVGWSLASDGSPCAADGIPCTADECSAGVCAHPNLPAGTLCDDGNPCTGTGGPIVGPDTCDGAGVCSGMLDPECADDCVNAVDAFEGMTTGSNVGFGPDNAEASCQPNSNHDAWFAYTATCNGDVLINTEGSVFLPSNDTVLSVLDACGGVEIACDDDSGSALLSSLIIFTASANTTYYIRVAGFGDSVGDIVLNIERLDTCRIGGVCIADGASNPANECEVCLAGVSNTSWSPRLLGTSCGDPSFGECDSPDACNASGVCEPNHKPDNTACTADANECTSDVCLVGACSHPFESAGTACGDPTNTECDNPDTCDGAGACLTNLEQVGFACGDPINTDCNNPDTCDGAGTCTINFEPDGTLCTDDLNDCTMDFCSLGACTHPNQPIATPCGDPANTDCDNPDSCDGAGVCRDNLESIGFACGDPTNTDCNNPDTCNGAGLCLTNFEPDATVCTDDANACTVDFCTGGVCTHPNEPPGTACGNPVDTECDNPDTCDGLGGCQPNREPFGFACGDATNTDCNNPDICDGVGVCLPNLESDGTACTDEGNDCTDDVCTTGFCVHPNFTAGTACGDPSDSQCDHPDTCDGFGFCEANLELDATPCDDTNVCTGPDLCMAGVCDSPFIPQPPVVGIEGPRVLVVTPQPASSTIPQALLVTSPDQTCLRKYIDASGLLVDTPFLQSPVNWGTVIVQGRELIPSTTYEVTAECGGDLTAPVAATTAAWGDVNEDMTVNLFDLFCVLDGFAGDFTNCSFGAVDIDPCTPDGNIGVFDLFAVLEAFAGAPYPCAGPCGGGACCDAGTCTISLTATQCQSGGGMYQGDGIDCIPNPCPAPPPASATGDALSANRAVAVSVVPSRRRVTPGATVKVHVFVTGAAHLKAYELSVAIVGGLRGRFDPVDVAIDASRSDYVFGSVQNFHAVDRRHARIVSAASETGVALPSGDGYLGSFVFRASPDAMGTFRIEMSSDQDVYLLDPHGRSMAADLGSASVTVQSRTVRGVRIDR